MFEDRHIRRSGNDYAEAYEDLLPTGPAWPRDADSILSELITAQAQIWGNVDGRAADLLEREADPRSSLEMLEDWERVAGLPDPCVAETLTISDRQRALVNKLTTTGGQSRAFFISVAQALGYTIEIEEFSPFMCGVSRLGDTRPTGSDGEQYRWEIGAPEMRFYWRIKLTATRLSWFRVGGSGGQVGIDPMLRIGIATDLECVLRRWKPAHTEIIFDYSEV